MSAEKFKSFQLHFDIICRDCEKTEKKSFSLGKFLSLEGDLIINEVDEINICFAPALKTLHL